jgi:coenzyme PQQ precursor peptide PqqA
MREPTSAESIERQKREEVKAMTLVWETPEFEEVAVTPEVTMYLGRMAD